MVFLVVGAWFVIPAVLSPPRRRGRECALRHKRKHRIRANIAGANMHPYMNNLSFAQFAGLHLDSVYKR